MDHGLRMSPRRRHYAAADGTPPRVQHTKTPMLYGAFLDFLYKTRDWIRMISKVHSSSVSVSLLELI